MTAVQIPVWMRGSLDICKQIGLPRWRALDFPSIEADLNQLTAPAGRGLTAGYDDTYVD